MPQFLAAPEDIEPIRRVAVLRGEEARHLVVVLRAGAGQRVNVFDGQGHRWTGRFAGGDRREARLDQLEPRPPNESPLEVELIQAVTKGETFEWILEKGTELGAVRFQPVFSARSVPRIPGGRAEEKRVRWCKRVVAAAKQCERARLPSVAAPEDLSAHLSRLGPAQRGERRLFLAERTSGQPSEPGEAAPRLVRIAVGPEGGWEPAERGALDEAGFRPVALGPRILRAETAALAGLVIVQSRWGDIEGVPAAW